MTEVAIAKLLDQIKRGIRPTGRRLSSSRSRRCANRRHRCKRRTFRFIMSVHFRTGRLPMSDRTAIVEPTEEIETLVRFLKRNARLDTASPTALYRRVQEALR